MRYIVIILSLALGTVLMNFAFELGQEQGYAKGYQAGQRLEPDTAQCIGYWFGGKVPANRMNELKNFCKEMK